MNSIPLEVHSDFSIQESFCRIPELVKFAAAHNLPYLCLTDTHSVSGAVELLQELEKINKKRESKIVPVLGCKLRILKDEAIQYITVLAKNKQGWHNLLKILNMYLVHDNLLCTTPQRVIDFSGDLILVATEPNCDYSKHFNDIIIATQRPVHYLTAADAVMQRLVICSKHKATFKAVEEDRDLLGDDHRFFESDQFCFPVGNEWIIDDILKSVQTYSLASQPNIPVYTDKPNEMLTELCREGWRSKKINEKCDTPEIRQAYTNRIKEELQVLTSAGLANYMLIVRDIMLFCHKNKIRVGLRGSATGCMVSYLSDISDLDPMRPDPTLAYDPAKELLFERFFNSARLSADRVSLPDCDIDVEPHFREQVFEYLRNTYGLDRSGQIITFLRMDGRAAIKEIFRIMQPVANSVNIADDITRSMIDTSKVQDVLADIQEEDPTYTIIHYNIDMVPKIKEYYNEYKDVFDQAIRLTNLIRSTGKHAAGIVVANQELDNFIPVTYDIETGHAIVAFEMADAEYVGAVKFDILGVHAYEKISKIIEMVENGRTSITV